ncbi:MULTISPECIES: 50S ribosomal protein L22 [Thermoanaerobacterium]|uniref:Large ribosomal subunit protein uL22 n=3 Tax=Thermoanaerobacterium thermosaccharolyticum TaxID=1517 RepID=D9TRV9_THETC|nr:MULTISPECIES: 50S ribosomal protein L22 [Thermoanaerobacterium]MDK2806435.1 large subunit ribosomal protein [Thermoanaerobacterium sp.]TCW42422.1 LSU ribosomal protein L22P [Thermohydrogenium kirishiense]ADL68006.1 ribosomal protein L22 [Thermoanaerobacterium thermosaccharolyticum DSM 571]AGB18115.1 ribosomal protein L22, bacterial type [Thermoanaerobacterium thermosaccharolyticum M0795]AST57883.1 ribosomal protein L22 [Thermoanaerobacterium thermosaccharolyticum]
MEAKAVAKYVRISPQKAGLVMNMIRGKDVNEALAILKFTPNKAAGIVEKVLKSAIANAENNFGLDRDNLYVAKAVADQGPIMKRMMPRAMGRSNLMRRRTSHITVVVNEK